jgi:two-component system, OmpR family, sensor histidine kinase MprB
VSLRWRIAIGLAVIAALVCALGAATAYVTTRNRLESAVDDSLLAGARAAALRPGNRPGGPSGGPAAFGGCPPPGFIGGSAAQVVDRDGTKTPCFVGSLTLPYNDADERLDAGEAGLRTVSIDGTEYRLLTLPRADGTTFQVARSLAENQEVLSSLRLQLLLISAIGIAAAAVLGWFFARRIVRPIEKLRATAEQIAATQDLDAPIPESGSGEVGSLAGSFSTMVGALAESKRQQQQLVADASHELRTPLTSLRTNAELLDRAGGLNAEQQERAVQGIRLEVNELTDLVSELVELATDRADDEVSEPVALGGLAEDVAARTRRRTGREITVTADGAAGTALIGPHAVDRALSNLVENAVKYSPGPIEVVVRGQAVEVLDRGPGIAPDDQGHVFDRFYRAATARTEPGSGLGLAIVQQIVERQGGRVWARSRDGGGAAVGFELAPPPS